MSGSGFVFLYHELVDLLGELPVDPLQPVAGPVFPDVGDIGRYITCLRGFFKFVKAFGIEGFMRFI